MRPRILRRDMPGDGDGNGNGDANGDCDGVTMVRLLKDRCPGSHNDTRTRQNCLAYT